MAGTSQEGSPFSLSTKPSRAELIIENRSSSAPMSISPSLSRFSSTSHLAKGNLKLLLLWLLFSTETKDHRVKSPSQLDASSRGYSLPRFWTAASPSDWPGLLAVRTCLGLVSRTCCSECFAQCKLHLIIGHPARAVAALTSEDPESAIVGTMMSTALTLRLLRDSDSAPPSADVGHYRTSNCFARNSSVTFPITASCGTRTYCHGFPPQVAV